MQFNTKSRPAVDEIVEKFDNKGLKDKIFADSFVSYMRKERSLEEIIVKNINDSLSPAPTRSSSSSLLRRVKHVLSLDYIQNNRNHLITSVTFLSVLSLAMIIRATQFIGKFLPPPSSVLSSHKVRFSLL